MKDAVFVNRGRSVHCFLLQRVEGITHSHTIPVIPRTEEENWIYFSNSSNAFWASASPCSADLRYQYTACLFQYLLYP